MRRIIISIAVAALALGTTGLPSAPADFDDMRRNAERLVAERSYSLALEAYRKIDAASLDPADGRWVAFRLADLLWRSAPETADPTIYEESKRALERLIVDDKGRPLSDRAAAEALESLGDMHWLNPRRGADWSTAWQYYARALDWWAGASDLEPARQRYLGILWKATESKERYHSFGYQVQQIPIDILENALEIARTPADRARANFLLAMHLANRGDAGSVERARMLFEAAIAEGPRQRLVR
jgi:alpha-2-macroglobulin